MDLKNNVNVENISLPFNNFLIAFYQYLQNLPSQCSDDNHGYDTTQEKHYHNRVNDRKPMNLHICHSKINVPSRGPPNIRLLPLYFICEI